MQLKTDRIVGCRSDEELAEVLADIRVIGGPDGSSTLKAGIAGDGDKRRALIASVRGGEHVELEVTARTFRQKDGKPNRRKLRFATGILGEVAASFAGMPVLLDHNQHEQAARIGTILSSELYEQGDGWSGFRQTLRIVKPDAVISILDGTLDRFSVGWTPTGPVLCSVHRTDVRGPKSCSCWPGDEIEMDGVKKTVEFEYTAAEGIEVSAVNVPAVKGTKIEDIRSALAVELSLDPSVHRSASINERSIPMITFTRLAALMGIPALAAATDEDSAVRAWEALNRRALAAEQERDIATGKLEAAEKKAEASVLAAQKAQVDGLIETAYRDGKLLYSRDEETGGALASKREARLRRIAKDDGVEALRAELDEMPAIALTNKRVLKDNDFEPRRHDSLGIRSDAYANAARQLGLSVDEIEEHANQIGNRRSPQES